MAVSFLVLLVVTEPVWFSAGSTVFQPGPTQRKEQWVRREGSGPNVSPKQIGEDARRASAARPESLAETGWSFGPHGYQHDGQYWGHPTPTHWNRIRDTGVWPFLPARQNVDAQEPQEDLWKRPPQPQPAYDSRFALLQQEASEQSHPNRWQPPQPPQQGSIPTWFPFHQPVQQHGRQERMYGNRKPGDPGFVRPKWPSNADPGNWRNGQFNINGWGPDASRSDSFIQDGRSANQGDQNPNPGPALSAYEPDATDPYKEWFGPFEIDYSKHSLVTDWNVVVQSPGETMGRGNLVVGNGNFYPDATNSFISGYHNTVRGKDLTAAGGENNAAEGTASVVVGGRSLLARGNFSVGAGGDYNQADGNFVVVAGGKQNRALGEFSESGGGEANLADGHAATATGGKSNEASGEASAIHGGSGNRAVSAMGTVSGGLGQATAGEGDHIFKVLTEADKEAVASMATAGEEGGEGGEEH